jgi:hypothetical protein
MKLSMLLFVSLLGMFSGASEMKVCRNKTITLQFADNPDMATQKMGITTLITLVQNNKPGSLSIPAHEVSDGIQTLYLTSQPFKVVVLRATGKSIADGVVTIEGAKSSLECY